MWDRIIKTRLKQLSQQFPAVLILGPRQVGKTTLAQMAFPEAIYCDLEDPLTQGFFKEDIVYQLTKHEGQKLILDEAQVLPEIFPALRSVIDKRRKLNGQYILLGSAQPTIVRSISESLAGRVGVIELSPLMMQEISSGIPHYDYRTAWLKGGFPDAIQGDFRTWWDGYLKTFIERDLTLWGINTDPILMRRFLTMLAHQQGGILNSSEFGRALGVTYHTVNRYLAILEQTFIIRQLQPFFRNIKKRLVKSPKVYIRDSGLLHHLLNINTFEELESNMIVGSSWETFVLEDILRREQAKNPFTQFFFWRTQAGSEIDLVLERGSQLYSIEIKSGLMTNPGQIKKLEEASEDVQSLSASIVNQSDMEYEINPKVSIIGFNKDYSWLPSFKK